MDDAVAYRPFGFDALSEFPPHGVKAPRTQDGVVHPGVMPSWDNSARRPSAGHVFHGSSPALFADWLEHAVERAKKNPRHEQMVFINAWNEWAEGAYLEPDQRFGYAYLEACASVLRKQTGSV